MQQPNPWVSVYLPLVSTIVVAVATVLLAWLTLRYVRLTSRMLEETQRSREPLVTVDFELPDQLLRLVVSNHGLSPAQNIRIEVLKDVRWLQMRNGLAGLTDCAPMVQGISYLTPMRKLKYYLGHPNWQVVKDIEIVASLRVSFEDGAGGKFSNIVEFDFGQMRDVLTESFKDPALSVAAAIRDAEQSRRSNEFTHNMFRSLGIPKIPNLKKCPMCAEMIPEEAKKCSHCLEMQPQDDSIKSSPAVPPPEEKA